MKSPRDWFPTSPHGTAKERFAQLARVLGKGAADREGEQRGEEAGLAEVDGQAAVGTRPGDELSDFFRNVAAGAHAHDLGDESLYLAEELARLQWSLGTQQRRALALLVLATMISVRQGSSRLPLERSVSSYLGQLVTSLLRAGKLDLDTRALLRDIERLTRGDTLDYIIGRESEYRPLIVADGCVYQHRMLWCENRLADRLRARLWHGGGLQSGAGEGHDPEVLSRALAEVLARPAVHGGAAVTLSDEQVAAVQRAVAGRLTVISGGPGTGKTAIVVTMLRVLRRLGEPLESIALAAPTGKAANRMWTSIRRGLEAVAERDAVDEELFCAGVEPQTLHRLLGYVPDGDRFRHHENNPLAATTVIVDEASMIDLVLMERLLRALPAHARLVVLGDADQLPSVDAGAVLRDLVQAGTDQGFAVRLGKSFRMDAKNPAGRAILTAAQAVNAGDAAGLMEGEAAGTGPVLARRTTPGELAYQGVEFLATGGEMSQVHGFIDHWFKKRIRGQGDFERLSTKVYCYRDETWAKEDEDDLANLFAMYETSRLLAVTRRQSTGSEAINQRLHRRILANASLSYNPDFYPGEPVMMRRNDYERGLFNGDQGMVVRVSENGGPQQFRVVFPRGGTFALFRLDALRTQIELSFAMTVHKSQGSEFDEVALILPAVELPLLTREMLYTGMTRARRSVVLVGTEDLLRAAVLQQGQRFSGLADKLGAAPASEVSAGYVHGAP